MAFFTGRTGSLVFNNKPVAKIRDWSLETTVELLSTNTIDSGVNTFVPGVKGATGSATLMYYRLESGEGTSLTEFTELLSKIMKTSQVTTNDRVTIELNVAGGTASATSDNNDIKFSAYITSASLSVSTGELTVVPINFTVDGEFDRVIN
tara:strand:+ start:4453 stop:4902 length:450 start_codon:yes stop_codon:yes gene_type:complete